VGTATAKPLLFFALLSAFLCIAYLPGFGEQYMPIDDSALIDIPQLQGPVSSASLRTIFTPGTHIDFYPFRDLSYLADIHLVRDLSSFRLQNFFWFLGISALVFLLLLEFSVRPNLALFVTGLWSIHPVHAEMIMWISSRRDLMALFFALASALFYCRGEKGNQRAYLYSCFLFMCSLLSGPGFSLLPISAATYAFLGRRSKSSFVFALTTVGFGLVSVLFRRWFYTNVNDMRDFFPLTVRLYSSAAALGKMTAGWLVPSLNILDSEPQEWLAYNRIFLFPGIFLWVVGILAGAYFFVAKRFGAAQAVLLCVILYLPTSALSFPFRTYYSVRSFEPVALSFYLALVVTVVAKWKISRAAQNATWFVFAFLAVATFFEGRIWESNEAVLGRAYYARPESISVKSNYWNWLNGMIFESVPLDLRERKLNLELELKRDCLPSPTQECIPYYQLVRSANPIARNFLEQMLSQTLPESKKILRIRFEEAMRTGKLSTAETRGWLQSIQWNLLPIQRVYTWVSICLQSGGFEASVYKKKMRSRSLWDESLFEAVLRSTPLRARLRECSSGD